jgi:hypothetical protein
MAHNDHSRRVLARAAPLKVCSNAAAEMHGANVRATREHDEAQPVAGNPFVLCVRLR